MEITQVKVFPVEEDKLKAFVSVVFDHCFMVNDIKVIQGRDGLFLSMPSRRKRNGEFKDVAHPLNNETRRLLEESVLEQYRAVVDDETPRRPDREEGEDPAEDEAAVPAAETGRRHPAAAPPPAPAPAEPAVVPLAAGAAGEPSGNGGSGGRSGSDPDAESRTTLEKVRDHHLSDSFWSVT